MGEKKGCAKSGCSQRNEKKDRKVRIEGGNPAPERNRFFPIEEVGNDHCYQPPCNANGCVKENHNIIIVLLSFIGLLFCMETLVIEVERRESPLLKEGEVNDFINKQLVFRMFDCLDGGDFEKNMLLEMGRRDKYTGVKLAGKGRKDEEYVKKILEYLDRETIETLLYICRFCSYLGGPGFPDLIVFKQGLRFTSMDLPQESIMFALLARELGIENIKIVKVVPPDSKKLLATKRIPIRGFLEEVVNNKRFSYYWNELEALLQKEREQLGKETEDKKVQQRKDEIAYLEGEKEKMPFFLIKKWLEEGVDKKDILDNVKRLEEIQREEKALAERVLQRLENDQTFKGLGRGIDEESIKRKRGYIMETFGIGPSRTEELLKRVEGLTTNLHQSSL